MSLLPGWRMGTGAVCATRRDTRGAVRERHSERDTIGLRPPLRSRRSRAPVRIDAAARDLSALRRRVHRPGDTRARLWQAPPLIPARRMLRMRRAPRLSTVPVLLALAVPLAHAQSPELPQPSPRARVEQRVGVTDFSVEYSSPGVKGRKIWGGLVPYDELWRTGANAADQAEGEPRLHLRRQEGPRRDLRPVHDPRARQLDGHPQHSDANAAGRAATTRRRTSRA